MTRKQWAARELGIGENSSKAEARAAYRRLIKKWHPDSNRSSEQTNKRAEEESKRLNLAYELLMGKHSRGAVPRERTDEKARPPSSRPPKPASGPTTSGRRGANDDQGSVPREEAREDGKSPPALSPRSVMGPPATGWTDAELAVLALLLIVVFIALWVLYAES